MRAKLVTQYLFRFIPHRAAMYRYILVPLDGSSLAEEILPQAKELARLTGAEIGLLRVALLHTFPGA